MIPPARPTRVIGVGNPDRGDDAAGRETARRLRKALGDKADIVELDGETTALLAQLDGVGMALLIDACVSGARPGTVRRIDLAKESLPSVTYGLSSHALGLAEAIELATALGQMPPRCVVYLIEALSVKIGEPLSDPVAEAVDEVVRQLTTDLFGLA